MPEARMAVTAAILIACSICVPLAQGTSMSGSSESVQSSAVILQEKGVDNKVDYSSLTKYGPWDDRNYCVTLEDLALIPDKDQYLANVPVFFKIYLRKNNPEIGEYYPRSALQQFQILHGGLMVNGVLYREGLGMDHPSESEITCPAD